MIVFLSSTPLAYLLNVFPVCYAPWRLHCAKDEMQTIGHCSPLKVCHVSGSKSRCLRKDLCWVLLDSIIFILILILIPSIWVYKCYISKNVT